MTKSIDRKITRPKFCYDKSCEVVYSTYNQKDFERGFSFFCYGKLPIPNIFKEKEAVHENNLCHCYYTPLKGAIRFFMNEGDLWGEANAKIHVMNRLQNIRCDKCGEKSYKRISHICFKCER